MNDADFSSLQAWMAGRLRARKDLAKDPEAVRVAAQYFTGNDRLSPVEQLEIYREQFWLRHTASLVEDFPGLGGILGQSDWERLVEEYLATHAPTSRSLRDLGDRLPEFVATRDWLEHRTLCVDMARLEWAYVELFDAPDAARITPERLAAVPEEAWQTAQIVLNPALRLLHVAYPVADLRRALRSGNDPVPIPPERELHLVLYRSLDRTLCDHPVSAGAFTLLQNLQRGVPLVLACERAAVAVPEVAAEIETNIGQWFQGWGERAWIVDVITS